jgi:uncharacterized protein
MTNNVFEKEQKLIEVLKSVPSCLVAFSGGLDSAYLCMMAKTHVPGRVMAITVVDASVPESDLETAKKITSLNNIEHQIVEDEIDEKVRENPEDRCYHCKYHLFQMLDAIRVQEVLDAILDGENASDSKDNRPGTMAAREWGVSSPLAAANLNKDDIRILAKKIGLESWNRPQSACLSSRVPTGTAITDETLRKIDLTESLIRSRGIRMIRARVEGTGTRLELGQDENNPQNHDILKTLEPDIIKLGWDAVTIDPTGYVPSGLRRKNHEK